MKHITKLDDYISEKPSVVTLGKFDGVHRGHRKLLTRVHEIARRRGYDAAVFTFSVSPQVQMGARRAKMLMTNQERADRHSVCRFLIRRGSVHLVDGLPHDECSSLHTNHVERDLSHFHLTIVGEYITKLCKRCVHRCFLRRILRNCTKRRHHQRHQTIINTIHIGIKTYRHDRKIRPFSAISANKFAKLLQLFQI